jgi:cell division protein FtsB
MESIRAFGRHLRRFAPTVFAIFLVLYFLFHSIQGDRGLLAWARLSQDLEAAKMELTFLKEEHVKLDRRVSHLRRDNLDLDLLEERAREMLSFMRAGEVMILD